MATGSSLRLHDAGIVQPLMNLQLPEQVRQKALQRAASLDRNSENLKFLNLDPNEHPIPWGTGSGEYLRELLGGFAEELCDALSASRSVLRIRGLSTDYSRPRTPYEHQSRFTEIPTTLMNIFGVVDCMNAHAFAYATENEGLVIRDVVARSHARNEHSSQGWAYELAWHMDGAFRPLTDRGSLSPAPRWLVFGVIYDTPRVPISFAQLDDVLSGLEPQDIEELCQPGFDVHSPESFAEKVATAGVPVLVPDGEGSFFSRYNMTKCFGRTPTARKALQALTEELQEPGIRHSVDLSPGDVIVLDNWRSLHMRDAYTPNWNGTDRWLVRVYASPKSLPFVPQYSDRLHIWK